MTTTSERKKLSAEASNSLRRVQEFDPESISRTEELGRDLNFAPGVIHAQRLVELFLQVSLDVLGDFSEQRLKVIKQQADAQYNSFQQILKFSTTEQNPKQTRDALLQQLENAYDDVFEQLSPAIAYSVRRSTDFSRMEREARAAIQAIEDRTATIEKSLRERQTEAEAALEAIRKVAAEQGVSQQAIYFKDEAESHSKDAEKWLRWTVRMTIALGAYAILTLVIHKIPWLSPTTTVEAAQLAVSKGLIFVAIGYLVLFFSRNYLASRHNAVVNRHRQNSLVTYRALVEAAGDQTNREVVLTRAAESIFGAQATGFAKTDPGDNRGLSLVSVAHQMARPTIGDGS